MVPPVPVTLAGAGLIGVVDSEDQVVPDATFAVLKGSTRPEGHASSTCEGWALWALPSTVVGAGSISSDPEARASAATPPNPMVAADAIRVAVISSSTRIGRWLPQSPGRCPSQRAREQSTRRSM